MSKALSVSTARPRELDAPWTAAARQYFAFAEGLALAIYPWDRLELEVSALDAKRILKRNRRG